MIRKELKVDPISFMSKHLYGIDLNPIEQIYLISKCPHLLNFINNANKWTQRLYVREMDGHDIDISYINDRRALRAALKKNPMLCAKLDMVEHEREVSKCINNASKTLLEEILKNETVTHDLVRKIIFVYPAMITEAVCQGIDKFDDDLVLFVYANNAYLLESFKDLSPSVVETIIKEDINNIVYINKWIHLVSDDVILEVLLGSLMKDPNINRRYEPTISLINKFPHLFGEIIQTLYKNGFNKDTSFAVRLLLKEFNELIDDQLAALIIEMEAN